MRVLLVEDDEHKRKDVSDVLRAFEEIIHLDQAFSVASGVQMAVANSYDLILLDMTIPNFDQEDGAEGGQSFKNGGELIVRELIDEGIDFMCAVITQYETFNNETIDEISKRISDMCVEKYFGFVKYSTMNEDWKKKLNKIMHNVKDTLN